MLRFVYGLKVTIHGLLNGVGVKTLSFFRHVQALVPVLVYLRLLLVFFGVNI